MSSGQQNAAALICGMAWVAKMKTHYTATELASCALTSLPNTARGVLNSAKAGQWESRPRAQGKGLEYAVSSLPAAARAELEARAVRTLLDTAASPTPVAHHRAEKQLEPTLPTVDQLDDTRRAVAEARCALVAQVNTLALAMGVEKAVCEIVKQAAAGTLPELIQQLVRRANARKGETRTLSRSSLYRWLRAYTAASDSTDRLCRLATKTWGAVNTDDWPAWLGKFLAHYCLPSSPTVTQAYADFLQHWTAGASRTPSIHTVRRTLKQLPQAITYRGRHTGAALKAKLPFVRRDWSVLSPGDVWIGDGHGMKCRVINPETGLPGPIELTVVMDAASRLVVGWSINLSENVLAVSDALRHGMTHYAPPLIYYSDNGAGQTAKVLDADLTGILPRVGIHHETGIPGNPQGRGLIERFWQTVALPLAKKYATYRGHQADRDHLRLVNRDIDKAMRRAKKAETGTVIAMPHVPHFADFMADLTAAITSYNTQHQHSALPRVAGKNLTPQEAYQRGADPSRASLSPIELRDFFRPTFTRVAARGEVTLFNNRYFSADLMAVDGEKVHIGVDWHDPKNVTIRRADGRFVCLAVLDGNKRDAFPLSLKEKLLKERVAGQVKRAEETVRLAKAHLTPALTSDDAPDLSLIYKKTAPETAPKTPIFLLKSEREAWIAEQQRTA